jgi:hypothetical protein
MESAAAIVSRTHDYRRQARRLRHVLARRPIELHRKLRTLSEECNRSSAPVEKAGGYEPDSRARLFAEFAAGAISGNVLLYSKRKELLIVAKRLGIGRFEANLLIAATQHQSDRARPVTAEPPQRRSWAPALLVALTQAAIIAAIWWIVQ